MSVKTIEWVGGIDGHARVLDQTLLPRLVRYRICRTAREMWESIRKLRVRGAPAIGIAGALGVLLHLRGARARTRRELLQEIVRACRVLGTARPTAVNLRWALARMLARAGSFPGNNILAIRRVLREEALEILREDERTCLELGRQGLKLLGSAQAVLTHCNTGSLATSRWGTALSVVYQAHRRGRRIRVYATETRPLLQGSRLTCWELRRAGIPVTLLCDSAAGEILATGEVQSVWVGADRIAANGDVANKIGTYPLAVLAKENGIPFYVVAPLSSFDRSRRTGREIPIEERSGAEIVAPFGRRIAPRGIQVRNPAFDVTPARYITAIVTERGILVPPFRASIGRCLSTAAKPLFRRTAKR